MKLGSIQFINSLPVDLGILSGVVPCPAEIFQGVPSELNRRMADGGLDAGPVSVLWVADHPGDLLIFPDLSVSSRSGVRSVLLFSRRPLADLKGKTIAVSNQGQTTPALLEILCRLRYGFEPRLVPLRGSFSGIPEGAEGALVIGDEALRGHLDFGGKDLFVTDLAEEWRCWTQLPIVFAVWAVRREVYEKGPRQIARVHEALLRSKSWGLAHGDRILQEAEKIAGLPRPLLEGYFAGLSYDLDEELRRGMKVYLDFAARCGLIQRSAPWEEIAAPPLEAIAHF